MIKIEPERSKKRKTHTTPLRFFLPAKKKKPSVIHFFIKSEYRQE